MRVLSLFDGMSCGQLALQRAGIPYEVYYASEIDKYAIQVTQKNFPDTVQVGSVTDLVRTDVAPIDLLIGGSPCVGFSMAGKQLQFDDPRSRLFFEYVRLLQELQPRYFLLENVPMKRESKQVISDMLGVEPVKINSALVSAQSRRRLYWTNIPNVTQPEDRGIVLQDILETGLVDRKKSYCIDANYFKGGKVGGTHQSSRRLQVYDYELAEHWQTWYAANPGATKRYTYGTGYTIHNPHGKSTPLFTGGGSSRIIIPDGTRLRKLTPMECERLQTVPDNYTSGVSDTQRYKMLGNGWTVDVIAHILRGIVK
jgi:DNA (cytosine-5)-methyltransferase 3A